MCGPNGKTTEKVASSLLMCSVGCYGNVIISFVILTQSGIKPACYVLLSVVLANVFFLVIQVLDNYYISEVLYNWEKTPLTENNEYKLEMTEKFITKNENNTGNFIKSAVL